MELRTLSSNSSSNASSNSSDDDGRRRRGRVEDRRVDHRIDERGGWAYEEHCEFVQRRGDRRCWRDD
jgi:hypothetical protein